MLFRSTPAHAGKSASYREKFVAQGDHPRTCGEKKIAGYTHALASGSPPRMRGKVHVDAAPKVDRGITPAYAGKSTYRKTLRCSRSDHPRVCGEKTHTECMLWSSKGSPPRMRGKGQLTIITAFSFRITPAYAGKSYPVILWPLHQQDHPRVCGEKSSLLWALSRIQGSPPRMRGKAHKEEIWQKGYRITPAHAGKRKC